MAVRENKCASNLKRRKKKRHLKAKKSFWTLKLKKTHLQLVATFPWNHFWAKTAESEEARRQRALRATAAPETFCIHSPLCHTKISLFNIQADLQIAFLYESLSLWLRPLNTFIRAKNSFANETPGEVQPCPTERQDAFPLFTQHGSGGDGRHSLALLISLHSKQILFNSGIISLNVSPLTDIR